MNGKIKVIYVGNPGQDKIINQLRDAGFILEVHQDTGSLPDVIFGSEADCVISSLKGLGKDPIKLLNKIRSLGNSIPVFVLVFEPDAHQHIALLEAGATELFSIGNHDSISELVGSLRRKVRKFREEKEKKKSEMAGIVRSKHLAEALKTIQIGYWEYNFRNMSLFVSEELQSLFSRNISSSKKSYAAFLRQVHPGDVQPLHNALKLARKGIPVNIDFRIIADNGFLKYINCQAHLIFDTHGTNRMLVGVLQDITFRKEKEVESGISLQSAEENRKVTELFLANITHELRTPLNGIIGISNLLLDTDLDDEQREFVEAIKTSGDDLSLLVNDLLDISKIASGKMTFEKKNFNLPLLIKHVLDLLRPKVKSKDVTLFCKLENLVPQVLIGDPLRLSQVLINLLDNAIKFTENGQVCLNVELQKLENEDVSILFVIEDTGIGIPDDKLETIFEDFTQACTSITSKYGGTGLGLSIVKNLVELQGGEIAVESQLGKGSAFKFNLSFQKGDADATPIEIVEKKKEKKSLKGVHVLVADDNAINRMIARKTLQSFGCTVAEAENGKIAVNKLGTGHYDMVMMDIQMPEMDGLEAIQFIRTKMKPPAKEIPIIAMTSSSDSESINSVMNAGASGYLGRPYTHDQLFSKILELTTAKKTNSTNEVIKDDPIIDFSYLRGISEGNQDFEIEIISKFLEEIPESFGQMKDSYKNRDWDRLKILAHKMKSPLVFIGMASAKENLSAIEKCATGNTCAEETGRMIESLEYIVRQAHKELKYELERLKMQN